MRASKWLGGLLGALALGVSVPAEATSVFVGYGGRDCDPWGRTGYPVYSSPGYGYGYSQGYDAWGRPRQYVIVQRRPVYRGDVVPFGYGYVQPGFVIGGGLQYGAPPFPSYPYGYGYGGGHRHGGWRGYNR